MRVVVKKKKKAASKVKYPPLKVVKRVSVPASKYRFEEHGVTQSMLSNFLGCRQRCRYSLDGWRALEDKVALAFGSLMHSLLERLYYAIAAASIHPGGAVEVFESYVRQWLRSAEKRPLAGGSQQAHFLAAQAKPVFLGYCAYWEKDFDSDKWVEVEGVFDTQWKGFRLRGRRDGLQRLKKYLRLMETKTKGQIPTRLDDALMIDPQNLFYLLTLNEDIRKGKIFKGAKPVNRVLYNLIRRPGIKLKQDESLDNYSTRIAKDIEKRTDHYFKRIELFYTLKDQKRFAEQLLPMIQDFAAFTKGKLPTYRNAWSCITRWVCAYLGACTSGKMNEYSKGGRLFTELED